MIRSGWALASSNRGAAIRPSARRKSSSSTPGANITPITPPRPAIRRICSSVRLREMSHRARHELWLAMNGRVAIAAVSAKAWSDMCETSTRMPRSSMPRTTSRPSGVSPPPSPKLEPVSSLSFQARVR